MKINIFIFLILGYCSSVLSQKIVKAEYFIDGDKGIGKNTPISIAPADYKEDLLLSFNVNLNNISSGMHTLYLRVQDENKHWSIVSPQLFQVVSTLGVINIVKAEYFIDSDPGIGLGKNISINSPTAEQSITFDLDLNSLKTGLHTFYARVKDSNNIWSFVSNQNFYLTDDAGIAKVKSFEYYFKGTNGNSPSYIFSSFAPASVVELNNADLLANVSELEYDKQYTLYIRALNDNGKYSPYSTLLFTFKKLNTGIDNLQSAGLSVYPNPVADYLYLNDNRPDRTSSLAYSLYDMQGKKVSEGQFEQNRIDLNGLALGNYILIIKDGETIYKGEVLLKK